jgi:nucleotide-binding universal stress UspA family protein
MNTITDTRKMLVGTDYSEGSQLALTQALELATRESPIELHVLHVVVPPIAPYVVLGPQAMADARTTLVEHMQKALGAFLEAYPGRKAPARVVCHVRVDEPAHELAQLAADLEADLILVGTHGRRALARVFLGSVAELVVRLAPCPVLVVRPKSVPQPVPQIEPPCPRCVEARKLSNGEQYWCEQHRERHGQRHTYHQGDRVSTGTNFPLVYTH